MTGKNKRQQKATRQQQVPCGDDKPERHQQQQRQRQKELEFDFGGVHGGWGVFEL